MKAVDTKLSKLAGETGSGTIYMLIHNAPPRNTTNALLLMDVARGLRQAGWRVTIFCSKPPSSLGPLLKEIDGIRVRRYFSPNFDGDGALKRLLNMAVVDTQIFLRVLFGRRPDVVLADTTTMFLGPVAWLLSLLRGVPYVLVATEIFPDTARVLGMLRAGSLLDRIWSGLSRKVVCRAKRVIVLSETIRELLLGRYLFDQSDGADKVKVIHNWADTDRIKPIAPGENRFRKLHKFGDRVVVLYSGRIGLSHDLDTLLAGAELLGDYDRVLFVIIGKGRYYEGYRRMAEERDLSNVMFLPFQSEEMLPYVLSGGDLAVVSLRAGVPTIPSKFYPALAAGMVPISIAEKGSSLASLTSEIGLGVWVENGASERLASEIKRLADDGPGLLELKRRAREVVVERFGKVNQVGKYVEVIGQIVAG